MCFKEIIDFIRNNLSKVVWILVIGFLTLMVYLYATLFYIFGAVDAIIKANTGIYDSLIISSFTLAGFSMTFAGILHNSEKQFSKEFFKYASTFIISGILLFSNIIMAKMSEYIKIENNATLNNIFYFFVLFGGLGILIFFVELGYMANSLIKFAYKK